MSPELTLRTRNFPAADIRLHRAPNLSRAGALLADHLVAAMIKPAR
jgi:hypothetical protein